MSFGRLERSAAPAPMSDINMTPLIDVMLVLVVIFIITAPLLASTVKLELPRADAAKSAPTVATISVAIDASGQAYLSNQPVSLEQLAQAFARAAQAQADTEVQLRADQAVPYGRVIAVMGAAQKAGLNRIGFVADPSPATTPGGAAIGKP